MPRPAQLLDANSEEARLITPGMTHPSAYFFSFVRLNSTAASIIRRVRLSADGHEMISSRLRKHPWQMLFRSSEHSSIQGDFTSPSVAFFDFFTTLLYYSSAMAVSGPWHIDFPSRQPFFMPFTSSAGISRVQRFSITRRQLRRIFCLADASISKRW